MKMEIPIREVRSGDWIENYREVGREWENPPCRWLVHSVEPDKVTYTEIGPGTHVFWDDTCGDIVVLVERK